MASPAPAIQFVRVHYGESSRIVTFYQDQPVRELRALLGSLFPGTTSAAGRRPVAIERLQTGVVVPLSSAAKFPSVMDDGNWDLLVSRETDVRTEKKILMGFIEDMTAHAFLTPDQCDVLNVLLNASDAWVLHQYRAFQSHRDVRQLKEDLVRIAEDRRAVAHAVRAAGVNDFFPRMIRFVDHIWNVGMVTEPQADVLYDLVDSGAAVVFAAYHAAREKNDAESLVEPMRKIANFYLENEALLLDSSEDGEGEQEYDGARQSTQTVRPPTPSPYVYGTYGWSEEEEEEGGGEEQVGNVDPLDLVEMLIDTGLVSGASAQPLRDVVVSNNPYVEAAIELYQANGDAEDLADTLQRLVPDAVDATSAANAAYAEQQRNDASWASAEAALRLIGALTEEQLFSDAAGGRLQDLLTTHFGSSQQQVLVAAYEVYEHDGDASEFVDTCLRVLRQIEELSSKHASAFALVISDAEGGDCFSPQAQDALMALWHAMEPRVMAAWDVFLEDQNISELVDTLSRIIALEYSIDEANESDEEKAATTKEDFVAVMNSVMELMLEEGHTDVEGAAVLAKLLDEQNPVVQAAYDAFCTDEDIDELVDTLMHTISYVQDNTDKLNCAELFDFVETIVSNDKMTAADGEVAAALIERRDPRVMAAYDVYFEDQDVHELIDTIERTVSQVRAMFGAQRHVVLGRDGTAVGNNIEQQQKKEFSSSEEESAEDESDSDGDGDAELVEGSEPIAVLQQVVAAAYKTGKIQYETALELMKPSRMTDPRFLAALDTFAEAKDLDDLFDSLGHIGRAMIEESASKPALGTNANSSTAEGERNGSANSDGGDDSSSPSDSEMSMDDSAVDTTIDYNQFEDDEDDSDSEWDRAGDSWDEDLPLPFSSSSDDDENSEDRHADSNGYEHTYEELAAGGGNLSDADEISDLLNKLNLSDENMQQLSDLMNRNDPVISAAFQVYETDGDVHDLKDTLLRVLARVNFVKDSNDAPVQPASKVLSDLVSDNLISESEGKQFQHLLNDDHPVAQAALEVYGVDGDWVEFVDTMRRIR
jgi:hypothetical protein